MPIKDPEVVSDYIAEEQSVGRLVELSSDEAISLKIHCSPIGIIPKKDTREWHLIVNLSLPEDASVNIPLSRNRNGCRLKLAIQN